MESVHAISFAVKIFSMLGLEVTFSILAPPILQMTTSRTRLWN